MRRKVGLFGKIIALVVLINTSFILMGGCINPFIGPTIGEAQVEGLVLYRDNLDNQLKALSNVYVSVDNSLESTTTDGSGKFNFTIRYRVGNLAKSASVTVSFDHIYASGGKSEQVIIKDGFTSTVPTVILSLS